MKYIVGALSGTDFNLSKIKLSDTNTKNVPNDKEKKTNKKHKVVSFNSITYRTEIKTSFEIAKYLPPILQILNSIVLKLNIYKTLCRGYLLY